MVIDKVKNVIENFRKMDLKTLEAYKYMIMGFIVIDMFGIYYYLKLKSLALALMLIAIAFLTLILFLEKTKKEENDKMDILGDEPKEKDEEEVEQPKEKKEEKVEKSKQDEEEDSMMGNFEFGMPTPESCARAISG